MSLYSRLCDEYLGPCVSRTRSPGVHLTFDDGPVEATGALLDCLEKSGTRATFFVVVERAKRHPEILRRMQRAGHAIGNHSLDHTYLPFFQSDAKIREWIKRSHDELASRLGEAPIAFRSPAGVRTPPLHRALKTLGIPLVHWSHRFYDTVLPWNSRRANRAARMVTPGSILLLHDSAAPAFLTALENFAEAMSRQELTLTPLSPTLVK